MTDRDRKDPGLEAELDRLGEAAPTEEERALASRLAGRLEGGPQAVGEAGAEEEVAALAELSRALGGGAAGTRGGKVAAQVARAGEAATDRALEAIYGTGSAREETAPEGLAAHHTTGVADGGAVIAPSGEAPADDLEVRRARRLAEAVDRLVAGAAPAQGASLGSEERALLDVAGVVRASAHARRLSASRVETLVDEAIGRPRAARRSRLGRAVTGMGLVVALAASVAGLVFFFAPQTSRAPEVPAHLSSRSTRDILPGAFPRSQSETERIDLIYYDRLRAYRDVELGALAPPPDGSREGTATPTAALAGRLGGVP